MTDYTDPESPVADAHAVDRKQWRPWLETGANDVCVYCGLHQTNHINDTYCPEWRLRQLDGDR